MPFDPVELSIFNSLFSSIAEEMGVALGRTAYSPNIKERRDYSCAVFDPRGRMVSQAAHIPVHLGAMPHAVRVATERFAFLPGDLVIFNDPYLGGTHLPDITMVSPVFEKNEAGGAMLGYLVSRAHHADVGGISAGSMPLATELYQEGIIIPPIKVLEAGQPNQAVLDLIYRNVRTPQERKGDLTAQMAAHRIGELRLREIASRYGAAKIIDGMNELMEYSERLTRRAINSIPQGVYHFQDQLDDDGIGPEPIPIVLEITVNDQGMTFDFTGSAPEQQGSVNAVLAVTESAVYYTVQCLLGEGIPINDGCYRPVTVIAPDRSVVNPAPPRAVSAGNVETSQRIVDVVLGALAQAIPDRIPAASQGTMNNITIGGWDPVRERLFAYYETIAGGIGAGPSGAGLSATHSHMTNTMNTPVEALEYTYPFMVREYAVRRGSGGDGLHKGGDGITRTIEFLAPATVTVISDRHYTSPYGLLGGGSGNKGQSTLITAGAKIQELPPKTTISTQIGDIIGLLTPGGGGWGQPPSP